MASHGVSNLMRSWQSVVGIFLGYFLGKYLSMALFWLPGIVIAARNISLDPGNVFLSLVALAVLVVVFAISSAIWVFINFFAIASWFSKAASASTVVSAIMMMYTTGEVIVCGILNWFPGSCSPPFWVLGWFP